MIKGKTNRSTPMPAASVLAVMAAQHGKLTAEYNALDEREAVAGREGVPDNHPTLQDARDRMKEVDATVDNLSRAMMGLKPTNLADAVALLAVAGYETQSLAEGEASTETEADKERTFAALDAIRTAVTAAREYIEGHCSTTARGMGLGGCVGATLEERIAILAEAERNRRSAA